jgi:hypothetical protein
MNTPCSKISLRRSDCDVSTGTKPNQPNRYFTVKRGAGVKDAKTVYAPVGTTILG